MSTRFASVQYMLEVSAKASRKEKGMKRMQIGKSEVTASLFIDVMVLYLKHTP